MKTKDTGSSTSIWIDRETHNDLRFLANANERSIAGQLRWMVKIELSKVQPPANDENQITGSDCN